MTSSAHVKRRVSPAGPLTLDGDVETSVQGSAKFVSKRGTEFEIKNTETGLYHIKMKAGGKRPPLCDEFFTSFKAAEQALELYLTKHDPLNLATYPSKEKNA